MTGMPSGIERSGSRGRGFVRSSLMFACALALSACTTLGGDLDEMAANPAVSSGYLPDQPRTPVSFEGVQSNDPQASIGRSQHPRIVATYGGAYSDPKLERMLAGIVGRLSAVSDDPGRAYRITILNSPNINAFALPGGYLYVTRGLLALANDSAEVAAVISHEMAHVAANHGIERQQREEAAELAGRVVNEVLTGDVEGRAALARGRLSLASFSRNQELQADSLGIRQTGRAGYDAYAAARFLNAMESFTAFRNAFQAPNAELDFLASHPAAPRRVQLARQHAAEFGAPGAGTADRDRYLDGIDGMLFGDTAVEGYVRGRSFTHPGLGIGFTVPQDFVINNTEEAVLATGPGDVAIRFDGVALAQSTSLVDYLNSGWVGGLDTASVRPIRLGELEAATARAAGGSYAFSVTVVRLGGQVYRFLTALPMTAASQLPGLSDEIAQSFRVLTQAERDALKPLRIRIVTARAGDTESSIAARMQGVDRKVELFRLLNGDITGSPVRTGGRYKIIAE